MLGAVKVVAGRIRALLLWIFATLRRACCCFRRRRRNSESQPLTAIGVVPNNLPPEEVTQGWESWGREEDEVTRQIREYRTSLAIARQQQMQASDQQQENQEDFFQDMTPKITRPPRIALENNSDIPVTGNSLLLAPAPLPLGSELGAWAEEEGWEAEEQGWEEEVREQRRQQRMKRAEEMQNKRTEHRMGLGSRLS